MGCFLGCFGLSSKRKRRKPGYRDHLKLGSYEPLDSVSTNLAITEKRINPAAELSKRPKESLNYKVRKKVSFNLNVQTYEPIPKEEWANDYWESDEEETNYKDAAKERKSSSLSEGDSMASKMVSCPSNYRYTNCIDSYDEEDEIAYEESDLDGYGDDEFDEEEDEDDDDDDDDDNNGCNIDELRVNLQEFSGQFSSLSVSSQNRNSSTKLGEDTTENLKPLGDSNEGGLRSRQYVHSVLKPVENLSQWKEVKARGMEPPSKQQRKENVAFEQHPQKPLSSISNISHSTPLMQEIAVDASLSCWVVPTDSCQKKTASNDVENKPSKKSLFESTYSWRNREDMPILDITNLEV